MIAVGGGHAVGLVVQGWLGDRVGLPLVTAATGLALLAIVTAVRLLRPGWMLAMDASAPGAERRPAPTPLPPALDGSPPTVPPDPSTADAAIPRRTPPQ
jgi:hypothetical protein